MWLPWKRVSEAKRAIPPQIYLTNSLSGTKELFVPLKPGSVSLYSCGPTVYGPVHIGNLRSYVFSDTLARMLEHAGFHVRRVMNITDVGHLVGEEAGGEGEDKMAVGAEREKVKPAEIAERYAKEFLRDSAAVGIETSEIRYPRATEYIEDDIALAKTLEEKGFAYRLPEGLYFDTSQFPNYGALGGVGHAQLLSGARVKGPSGKKHPSDFALWRSAKPADLQQWPSPWGRGNPGWSIECSAMARSLLGSEIDLHTGGEDLAQIHHNNEIAQSEAASGRTFVRTWMHNAFLNIEGEKISKSLGNTVYLADIIAKGFDPLALRYFFLQAHYRTPLSYSLGALEAAAEGLARLRRLAAEVREESEGESAPSPARDRFAAALRDDLATPAALAILWESLKSDEYTPEEKWGLIEDADKLLALDLARSEEEPEAPYEVKELLARRETARKARDFAQADELRREIENRGYSVEDRGEGAVLHKRR